MKKIVLSCFLALSLFNGFTQTATNFTCNDCSSISHDLFTELDAGKIIVITWVMPCGSCIGPSLTAATTVQSYASTYPGKVKFYLVDDYANTSCSTLNSWASTNGITYDASFSNAAIDMTDYGTAGMPKTVVLGGTSHTVFFNTNGTISSSAIQTAIDNAILTGVDEISTSLLNINLYPNPANEIVNLVIESNCNQKIKLNIINSIGEVLFTENCNINSNQNNFEVDVKNFQNGMYFVQLIDEAGNVKTLPLQINK